MDCRKNTSWIQKKLNKITKKVFKLVERLICPPACVPLLQTSKVPEDETRVTGLFFFTNHHCSITKTHAYIDSN